jgi:hypothetical protein
VFRTRSLVAEAGEDHGNKSSPGPVMLLGAEWHCIFDTRVSGSGRPARLAIHAVLMNWSRQTGGSRECAFVYRRLA